MPKKQRIGLLGGSFNPPHAGHVYISQAAMQWLKLDKVWWVVSPHNPLKNKDELASTSQRLQWCNTCLEGCKNIEVSDAEIRLGTRYSYDTLKALIAQYSDEEFVWLMGEDNWHQFECWHKWRELMDLLPVAVFHREVEKSWEASVASTHFIQSYTDDHDALASLAAPAWTYIPIDPQRISSTEIRNKNSRGEFS